MDKILEAVVTSSYPASVKQGLVRRVLEAARQPLEREQCLALLALGARLYVGGAEELPRRVGCQLLHVAGRHHPDVFAEFFSARRVLRLLQGDGPAADEVFALLRREVLRTVCERPGPATCAQVARLLARHPRCVPDGAHRLLFCQQLVRCLGRFRCPAEGEEGAVEFLEQAQQRPSLRSGGMRAWRAQSSPVPEEEPPSSALASVVQHLPLELMDGVVRNLSNDDSVTDSQVLTAISRMIDWVSWPLGKNIDKWIIALLKGLAAVKKFSILIEVSLAKIEKVFSKLLYPIVRGAALSVLKYMLLTFQHSHEAFHLLLPHIPPMVASLVKEDSNSGTSCLEQLAELVHCMVFRFPGFPDLYEPVMEAIKDLHIPNEDRIKQLLGQDAWTSQKSELAGFYPRLMAKSDTGKIGLINLGNTCYVNSVLQALFMASDFRHCVLRLTENNSQPLMTKLQWLFAFLEHSQRPAISPENFLSASWTPWFSPGTQQDCSEYLKYLLDRLHEEEKTGTRICQKLMQSSLPSPPEELPSSGAGATSVEKMFGGKIVTRICCLHCLNVSSREEAFTDLSLAFPPPERCRHRRLGSVMLPTEDVRAQELALAPRAPGAQRQRKHCITGDAPYTGLDIGLGSISTGGQSGQEEKVEREQAGKEKEAAEEQEEGEAAREEEEKEGEEKKEDEKEKESENGKEKDGDSWGPGTHRDAAIPLREQVCGPEGSRSVLDLVNYFLSPERLTAENRYYCESCASLQDAEKVVELSQGPRYLILTLLRFSFDLRTMRRRKILDDVTIPLLLRLPLAGGQGQAYDLCSVVVHSGVSSESGHYYCYAREGAARPTPVLGSTDRPEPENQWYLFNDTRVSFSSFESVSNVTSFFPKDTAYVLFYRQRPREGPEAEPGSPRVRAEPTLHKDLMEAISKDNVLYLQEQEKEARSRAAYISTLPAPHWGRGFDEDKDEDEGSPGGCNPAGGNGDFHRLVF
ncbi:hypothetical protein STEG23_028315 [Scotinomys teguina]